MHSEGLESLIDQARERLPDMADYDRHFVYVPITKEPDIDYIISGAVTPLFVDRPYIITFRKEYISGVAVRWVFDSFYSCF